MGRVWSGCWVRLCDGVNGSWLGDRIGHTQLDSQLCELTFNAMSHFKDRSPSRGAVLTFRGAQLLLALLGVIDESIDGRDYFCDHFTVGWEVVSTGGKHYQAGSRNN